MTEENSYVEVIRSDGKIGDPDLQDAWADILANLSEGQTLTVDELMDATGFSRQVLRALLYHGKKARKLLMVDTRRSVEVAPDLFVMSTVRGYRTPDR